MPITTADDKITLSMIIAVAQNGVIGNEGTLPWRLSSDLKMFRRLTMGKPLIMGRRTFSSLGKPLDGRDNIVVTRDQTFSAEGALVVPNVDEAVGTAKQCARRRNVNEIMVIGGAQIYHALANDVERIYWTDVEASPVGDTTFPRWDEREWTQTTSERLPRGKNDQYAATLFVLERKGSRSAP